MHESVMSLWVHVEDFRGLLVNCDSGAGARGPAGGDPASEDPGGGVFRQLPGGREGSTRLTAVMRKVWNPQSRNSTPAALSVSGFSDKWTTAFPVQLEISAVRRDPGSPWARKIFTVAVGLLFWANRV